MSGIQIFPINSSQFGKMIEISLILNIIVKKKNVKSEN